MDSIPLNYREYLNAHDGEEIVVDWLLEDPQQQRESIGSMNPFYFNYNSINTTTTSNNSSLSSLLIALVTSIKGRNNNSNSNSTNSTNDSNNSSSGINNYNHNHNNNSTERKDANTIPATILIVPGIFNHSASGYVKQFAR